MFRGRAGGQRIVAGSGTHGPLRHFPCWERVGPDQTDISKEEAYDAIHPE